jgi:hypothetical protein
MTTATARLNTALINLAVQGERVRCSDPVDHALWTSDDQRDGGVAVQWCAGCVLIPSAMTPPRNATNGITFWGGRDFTPPKKPAKRS